MVVNWWPPVAADGRHTATEANASWPDGQNREDMGIPTEGGFPYIWTARVQIRA